MENGDSGQKLSHTFPCRCGFCLQINI